MEMVGGWRVLLKIVGVVVAMGMLLLYRAWHTTSNTSNNDSGAHILAEAEAGAEAGGRFQQEKQIAGEAVVADQRGRDNIHQHEGGEAFMPSYPPLQVYVYYEALCPDSRYFILKQLLPAYQKLHQIFSVAFVPYGKAETTEKDGKYTFTCQHGPVECRANMVHACATSVVKDEWKLVDVVSCMIDRNEQPLKAGQKCMEKYGESWADIMACLDSDEAADILKHMGDQTHNLTPKVSFIPTIEIDGDLSEQSQIQQHFDKVLCSRYKGTKPPAC